MASASGSRSRALRPRFADSADLARTNKLRLTILIDESDEDGWIVARISGVPGAISQGRTREEARENIIDALRLMLAPDEDDANADRNEPLELLLQS